MVSSFFDAPSLPSLVDESGYHCPRGSSRALGRRPARDWGTIMKSISRVVLVVAMVGGLLSAAIGAGAQEAEFERVSRERQRLEHRSGRRCGRKLNRSPPVSRMPRRVRSRTYSSASPRSRSRPTAQSSRTCPSTPPKSRHRRWCPAMATPAAAPTRSRSDRSTPVRRSSGCGTQPGHRLWSRSAASLWTRRCSRGRELFSRRWLRTRTFRWWSMASRRMSSRRRTPTPMRLPSATGRRRTSRSRRSPR